MAIVHNPIEIERYLSGLSYESPRSRDELYNYARSHGANADVLETIRVLPSETYNSPNDIAEAFGRLK